MKPTMWVSTIWQAFGYGFGPQRQHDQIRSTSAYSGGTFYSCRSFKSKAATIASQYQHIFDAFARAPLRWFKDDRVRHPLNSCYNSALLAKRPTAIIHGKGHHCLL